MRKKVILLIVVSTVLVGGLTAGLLLSSNKIRGPEETTESHNIVKEPDLENCLFMSQSIPFDGKKHSLEVANLPTSCYAEYSGQNFVLPGKYDVSATIFFTGYNEPKEMKKMDASLTIYEDSNTPSLIAPRFVEAETDKSTEKLSSKNLKVNITLSNVFKPEEVYFTYNYGTSNESNSHTIEYTPVSENTYLFTLTIARMPSKFNEFSILTAVSPSLNTFCQINENLEIILPNEFNFNWSETEKKVSLNVQNEYLLNPTSVLISVDNTEYSYNLSGNEQSYDVLISKLSTSGIHEIKVKKVNFFSNGVITSLDYNNFRNSSFKYAIPDEPEIYFGNDIFCSDLENLPFIGDGKIALYVEKNATKSANINTVKLEVAGELLSISPYKVNLIEKEGKTYYKIFLSSDMFFGGETIVFRSIIANENEYDISFSQSIASSEYELNPVLNSTYDYETRKTTVDIDELNDFENKITFDKVFVNGQELDFSNQIILNGFEEEIVLEKIVFKDLQNREHEYVFSNLSKVTSTSNQISTLEISNESIKNEGISEKITIRSDKKIVASEIKSISITENAIETILTEGFVQISDYEIEIPYTIEYIEQEKTVSISSFIYSNDKEYELVNPCELSYSGLSAVRILSHEITGNTNEFGAPEIAISFYKNSPDVEIKYIAFEENYNGEISKGRKSNATHDSQDVTNELFYLGLPPDFDDTSSYTLTIKKVGYSINGVLKEKIVPNYVIVYQ